MNNLKNLEEQKDCFAYPREGEEECFCLKELYCKKEFCSFFKHKDTISREELEKATKGYNNNVK